MHVINECLKKIGLSAIESRLYLGLLERGPSSVLEIAKHTGIKRITAHFNLENLLHKGLVTQTTQGARRLLLAEPPETLNLLVRQKKRGLKEIEENLPEVISKIHREIPPAPVDNKVKIKYYEGKKSVKLIYDDVLKAKEMRAYVSSKIDEIFPENAGIFVETHRKRKDMKIWEIMDEFPTLEDYVNGMAKGRYFYKLIPRKIDIVDYLIYDGKVAIVDTVHKKPESVYGLLISNENYFKSSKMLFDFIWRLLPDQKT